MASHLFGNDTASAAHVDAAVLAAVTPGSNSTSGPSKPSSLVRFLPVSQYLLELASGVWVIECGVLTSREA